MAIEKGQEKMTETVETVKVSVTKTVEALQDKVEGEDFQEALLDIGKTQYEKYSTGLMTLPRCRTEDRE